MIDEAVIRRVVGGAEVMRGRLRYLADSTQQGCYRPRYLNIQRLNYLWTIRHSSARIAGNLIT